MNHEIQNARITSTSLGAEDHGIFTAYLNLDYGESGQGFGGFALDDWDETRKRRIGTAYGAEFVLRILATLEVSSWEKLPGTVCRVRASHSSVEEIGHFLKDQWFNPRALATENLVAVPKNRIGWQEGNELKDYWILSEKERAKGFVRPVRSAYRHAKCGTDTTMGRALSEIYARDPHFYGSTYCVNCGTYFPVGEAGEFTWSGSNEKVGT